MVICPGDDSSRQSTTDSHHHPAAQKPDPKPAGQTRYRITQNQLSPVRVIPRNRMAGSSVRPELSSNCAATCMVAVIHCRTYVMPISILATGISACRGVIRVLFSKFRLQRIPPEEYPAIPGQQFRRFHRYLVKSCDCSQNSATSQRCADADFKQSHNINT